MSKRRQLSLTSYVGVETQSRGDGRASDSQRRASGLYPCPVCSRLVPATAMSLHLDSADCAARSPSSVAPSSSTLQSQDTPEDLGSLPGTTHQVARAVAGDGGGCGERGRARVDDDDGDGRGLPPSRLVTCPVCGRSVPNSTINLHLDSRECSASRDASTSTKPQHETREVLNDAGEGDASEASTALKRGSWGFLLGRKPVAEYGVHTGLRGGCRVVGASASGVSVLEAADAAETGGAGWESDNGRRSGPSICALRNGAMLSPSCHLPGHFVIENFITSAEEEQLVAALDGDKSHPWRPTNFNGRAFGKSFGVKSDLAQRTNRPGRVPMPHWLAHIIERMPQVGLPVLRDFRPNECNAIDYRRALGHSLTPHVDDRQLSGDIICNLSLCGDSVMTYTREKGAEHRVNVRLPRRSLQVQAGGVRYEYQHSISNANLLAERRVSITFRECALSKTTGKVEGVRYTRVAERYKWGRKI